MNSGSCLKSNVVIVKMAFRKKPSVREILLYLLLGFNDFTFNSISISLKLLSNRFSFKLVEKMSLDLKFHSLVM